ncbi:MAG: hypothetical protein AAB489_04405 [Patescibacteria group bacterium]
MNHPVPTVGTIPESFAELGAEMRQLQDRKFKTPVEDSRQRFLCSVEDLVLDGGIPYEGLLQLNQNVH